VVLRDTDRRIPLCDARIQSESSLMLAGIKMKVVNKNIKSSFELH